MLQGSLRGATPPIPTTVAQPEQIPNGPDLWGVLDNELKPSLHLVVTLPLDLAQAIIAPLVLTKRIRVEQGLEGAGLFQEITQIAGTVRDGDGRPVAGAKMSVKGRGIAVTTDGDGHYTFPNLSGGPITLTVSAPGYEPKEVDITVPDRPDVRAYYDVDV
jgi:hypothetical protein